MRVIRLRGLASFRWSNRDTPRGFCSSMTRTEHCFFATGTPTSGTASGCRLEAVSNLAGADVGNLLPLQSPPCRYAEIS